MNEPNSNKKINYKDLYNDQRYEKIKLNHYNH